MLLIYSSLGEWYLPLKLQYHVMPAFTGLGSANAFSILPTFALEFALQSWPLVTLYIVDLSAEVHKAFPFLWMFVHIYVERFISSLNIPPPIHPPEYDHIF